LSRRFLVSCGEPSGDLYAGALTREMRALRPDATFSGLGGPRFAEAGGELLEDYRGLAVTGLTEVVAKLPKSSRTLSRLVRSARSDRPDALIVIDFPDFNLRLAERVRTLGVPIVYYIGPQIWAWRPGRFSKIRRVADRVLLIFPFEEAFYRELGAPEGFATFVGHPLVDLAKPKADRETFLRKLGLAPEAPTVAILPGSRPNELRRLLPDLMATAAIVGSRVPRAQFVVARAPYLDDERLTPVRASGVRNVAVVEDDADTVLASADVVVTASGTATVQAALHDRPMVVVYRVSPMTYRLGRGLVTLDTFAMVNLIAGERLVPELIQDGFTPESAADEAVSMLTDRARAGRIREGLARVRERLGGPGASRRAAETILQVAESAKAALQS
jgi:lipid-A-disaccharide synthase